MLQLFKPTFLSLPRLSYCSMRLKECLDRRFMSWSIQLPFLTPSTLRLPTLQWRILIVYSVSIAEAHSYAAERQQRELNKMAGVESYCCQAHPSVH
ncbi:hypothetical protein OIU77_006929 [Salix suchowensis]|uniref:Uncharacterized protein n=1 Tax=Salix suchowensis TaxID=1278906 RepID=A0ABQ9ANC7_9ROSI|nr:hypothetical protein OIU77_006929 [Salix suchowensis]